MSEWRVRCPSCRYVRDIKVEPECEECAYRMEDDRIQMAREEAAYVEACIFHGLIPYSSRDLSPDEARERMEELEQSRRDIAQGDR